MNSFQWMIRRYTGANVMLSEAELKQVEQRCNELIAPQRRFWLILLLTGITTAVASSQTGLHVGPLVASWTGWPDRWCRGGCALLAAGVTVAGWLYIFTQLYVRPLRRALTEAGYPICERCGYWLHGLPADAQRCPECGAAAQTKVIG